MVMYQECDIMLYRYVWVSYFGVYIRRTNGSGTHTYRLILSRYFSQQSAGLGYIAAVNCSSGYDCTHLLFFVIVFSAFYCCLVYDALSY